jgi:hypothetical protein
MRYLYRDELQSLLCHAYNFADMETAVDHCEHIKFKAEAIFEPVNDILIANPTNKRQL